MEALRGQARRHLSQELNLFAFFPGLNTGATIEALQAWGVVELLAEPNIVATNGKEASFLAGGEFPYPVVSGTSGGTAAVSIEFKQYGVRLNFIPTITPRGTIHLQVAPEVSALDYTHEVEISGFEVPGLTSRKVNTEVELKDGQSFMIGGLLDKTVIDAYNKIPFLGDIPILGKLFQSESKTKNDTELIVIVTPEIVAPIAAGAPLPELKYPSKFMPANSNIPMHQADEKTAENTLPPSPPTIPVEKLIESMKPEKPLVIEAGASGFGAGGQVINSPGVRRQRPRQARSHSRKPGQADESVGKDCEVPAGVFCTALACGACGPSASRERDARHGPGHAAGTGGDRAIAE